MKCTINDQVALLRAPEGPLALYIAPFSEWASEQGYALCSLRQRIRIAAGFSWWLAKKAVRLRSVSSGYCAQYLRYRARRQRIREGDATALRQLLDFLRHQGVIPAEKIHRQRLSPVERCAQAFERYLREERILAKATIVSYVPFVREFLKDSLKGKRITVHLLRHTMALELLQAGVDRAVIALWLGHESVETTQIYLEATLAMKEQALAKTSPPHATPGRYRPDDQLLNFLNSL
jgi:site-specific recombinase XerD